jgi:hypothetical protein
MFPRIVKSHQLTVYEVTSGTLKGDSMEEQVNVVTMGGIVFENFPITPSTCSYLQSSSE